MQEAVDQDQDQVQLVQEVQQLLVPVVNHLMVPMVVHPMVPMVDHPMAHVVPVLRQSRATRSLPNLGQAKKVKAKPGQANLKSASPQAIRSHGQAWQCSLCKRVFSSRKYIVGHMKEDHHVTKEKAINLSIDKI